MEKQNQQSIFNKEEFKWHYISLYLDSLLDIVPIYDEEFLKLFERLQNYVETKIFVSDEGEFVDFFVVVERKIK